jgi:glycosyltransferase involved in cell wall biosynthesis
LTRVLLCVHNYPPDPVGGTERHVAGLARALQARGCDVLVVAGSLRPAAGELQVAAEPDGGVRVLRVQREDLHYERWHKAWHPGVSRWFRELLATERPDVVHVHHWLRLTLDLAQQARAAGVPCVVTLHDSFATCPTIHRVLPDGRVCTTPPGPAACGPCLGVEYPGAQAAQDDALAMRCALLAGELAAADRLLVLSRTQRDLLRRAHPDLPLIVQPFTIADRLRPSPPPAAAPPLRVATLSHLGEAKAQHLLLEAVRALPRPRDVQVHLFGTAHEPRYAQRLRALAAGLDVVEHGAYTTQQLEAEPLHAVALTSLLPETYGLVLDEARMLGVPVLASDTGAYRERVGGGGAFFPPGGALALRDLLARALAEPAWLAGLRARVTPPPPFAQLVDFLEQTYAEVRALPPRAPAPLEQRWLLEYQHRRVERFERLALELWRRQNGGGPGAAP